MSTDGIHHSATAAEKPSTPAGDGAVPVVVATGIDAVNAAERALIGTDAVASNHVADGLAAMRRRSANLLAGDRLDATAHHPPEAVRVHHRLHGYSVADYSPQAIELVAAETLQQAVDHCLVAHRIVAQLHVPVVCRLDPALADRLGTVELPTADHARRIASNVPAKRGEFVATIADAFRDVQALTGRPCELVATHGLADAVMVVVVSADLFRPAQAAVESLRRRGVAAGLVSPVLCHPLPIAALVQILAAHETIIFATTPANRGMFPPVVAGVQTAHNGHTPKIDDISVVVTTPTADAFLAAVASALPAHAAVLTESAATPATTQTRSSAPEAAVTVAVVPAGPWAQRWLKSLGARLASVANVELAHADLPPTSALTFGHPLSPPRQGALGAATAADVVLVTSCDLLDPAALSHVVRDDATLVIVESAETPADAWWHRLDDAQRGWLTAHAMRVVWLPAPALATAEIDAVLHGAALVPGSALRQLVEQVPGRWDAVCAVAPSSAFSSGASAAVELTAAVRGESAPTATLSDPSERTTPRLPASAPAISETEWLRQVWRFHINGDGPRGPLDPLPGVPARPLALLPLLASATRWADVPATLPDDPTATVQALAVVVDGIFERCAAAGHPMPILTRQRDRLLALADGELRHRGGSAKMRGAIETALTGLRQAIRLSAIAAAELDAEITHFLAGLPPHCRLVGTDAAALDTVYHWSLDRMRKPRMSAFRGDVETLKHRLDELIALDDRHAPNAQTPEALSGMMGGIADRFFSPAVLAQTVPTKRGSKQLDDRRRERIESARRVLAEFLAETLPTSFGVRVGTLPSGVGAAAAFAHPDGMARAIGIFDALAHRMAEVCRAMRVARLEAANQYDSAVHDEIFARFDWQSCTAEELRAMPAVTVYATGKWVADRGRSAFSELLRSGRPIHVVVTDAAPHLGADESGGGFTYGLDHLALAHHEAFVARATLANPADLAAACTRMADVLRPAVLIASVPGESSQGWQWLHLTAAHHARGTPCFRYDPDAGTSFAARFQLAPNPEPGCTWPTATVTGRDAAGNTIEMTTAVTVADAAALDLAWQGHLRVVPPSAYGENLVPVADWLTAWDKAGTPPARHVPYILVLGDDGVVHRAVITRELGLACFARMHAWWILQEWGGFNNEYARKAADAARAAAHAEAAAEREAMCAAHAAEIEQIRDSAAHEVLERLAAGLLSADGFAFAVGSDTATSARSAAPSPPTAPSPPVAGSAPSAPTAAENAAPVPAASEADEPALADDPFIDTVMCTTCNECINLNPLMFKYDGNKQAYIADANAGTFAQLVRAAEKCPARCIHPNAPRPDDSSVTAELLALAATFN